MNQKCSDKILNINYNKRRIIKYRLW